jgi:hypothetical protein
MMNWTLEVEDVACPVDDISEENGRVHCSRSCVQSRRARVWYRERENGCSGCE